MPSSGRSDRLPTGVFMARWDYLYLGFENFPDALSALEIEHFFTLEPAELVEVKLRGGGPMKATCRGVADRVRQDDRDTAQLGAQVIPAVVLDHLGHQLRTGESTPQIASIRALYRRRRMLFDHQQAALKVLGFRHLHEQVEPGLIASLRRVAAETFEVDALVASALVWLFEHRYVIPPSRRLRRLAVAARRHHDAILLEKVEATVAAEVRAEWMPRFCRWSIRTPGQSSRLAA